MNRQAKRIVILLTGWGAILVGIAGLLLPIMPGWIFIFAGLVILSSEYVWAHHLLTRIRERFPKISGVMDLATEKAKGWMGRFSSQHEHD